MTEALILPKPPVAKTSEIIKEEILGPVREHLKNIQVFGNRILIGIYSPDTVGSGLILKATETKDEDIWQGNIGLVLAMGPGCFTDSPKWNFYRQYLSVGDWVLFRPSDGILQKVGPSRCRLIQDCYILAKLETPDVISQ